VKYATAVALILATVFCCHAAAQDLPLMNYTCDCKKLAPANQSQGCDSYNEMVIKADKDITGLFQFTATTDVLVCFRPAEDVFFIISYRAPRDTEYHPSKTPSILEAPSFLSYNR
jgi:hypothetical protein